MDAQGLVEMVTDRIEVELTDDEVDEALEKAKLDMIHAAMRKSGTPYPAHGRVEGIHIWTTGVKVFLLPKGLRLVKG